MAIRLQSEFTSQNGDDYKIEIHDSEWLGGTSTFNVSGNGFHLEYTGETDDIISPIISSFLNVPAFAENAAFETFLSNLGEYQDKRFHLEVFKDNGGYELFWVGWITQDLVRQEDVSMPYIVDIKATDGLGFLANIDYTDANPLSITGAGGLTKMTDFLRLSLNKIGLHTSWSTSDVYLETSVDWWETTSQTYSTTKDTLGEHGLDVRAFSSVDDNGDTTYTKVLEIIRQLAIIYNARIYQSGGRWVFEQYGNRAALSRYVTTYKKDGTAIATASVSDDITFDQTTAVGARLAGGEFSHLPAVNTVSLEYIQERLSPNSPPYKFIDGASTHVLGAIEGGTGVQLYSEGAHNYTISSTTGSTGNDNASIAVVFKMQIKIEDASNPGTFHYWTNTFNGYAAGSSLPFTVGSWSTTAGYFYYSLWFNKVFYGETTSSVGPTVTTTDLPVSGELTVINQLHNKYDTLTGSAYTLAAHQTENWSTIIVFSRLEDGRVAGQKITYSASNTNASVDSNIDLSLGEVSISSGLFQTGSVVVYNGTAWVAAITFRKGATGTGWSMLNLACVEAAALHYSTIKVYDGTMIYSDIFSKRLGFDSSLYLPISSSYNASNDEWSVSCFAIARDTTTIGDLDPIEIPALRSIQGVSGISNTPDVINTGRIGGMNVDTTQEKMGPFQQVTGGAKIIGALKDGEGSFGSSGQVLSSTVSGLSWITSASTNDYVTGMTFNTADGILTLTRSGGLGDITQDLDGRYLTQHPTIINSGSTSNANGVVVQSVTIDSNGHSTAWGTLDLDTRFLQLSGGTMTGNTIHNDNVKSIYGTASDGLEIYHDGSHSYIADTGTGDLTIRASNDLRLQSAATEAYLTCNENGSVQIYYNNSLKFETTSSGATITGGWTTTGNSVSYGNIHLPDSRKAQFGSGLDLEIYHDGSNSYIKDVGTGNLLITTDGASVQINKGTTENMAEFIVDGAVKLYYDSARKLETTSTGATITGALTVSDKIHGVTAGTANTDAVNVQQLNNATTGVLVYQGIWNASTNTPTLTSATGTIGGYYIVSVDGSTNLDGITDWKVGDWAVFSDMPTDAWQKIDNTSILGGAGTGGSLAAWTGSGTSLTLGDAPVTYSGNDVTVAGTVTATGGTSTEWNTGYDYSQVGHLPLSAGSSYPLTGDLYINETGGNSKIQFGGGAVNNEVYSVEQGVAGISNGGFSIRNLTESIDVLQFADVTGNATFAGTIDSGAITSTGVITATGGNSTTWNTHTTNTGTVTSVETTGTVSGITLTGTVTTSGILSLGGTLALTSANVTDGLGFTPAPATGGSYLPLAGGTLTASGTPLTINRTGGATALIGLTIAGTSRGLLGATTTDCFVAYSNTASPRLTVSNSGGATFAGTIGASNLSGTNTGDQDLSTYAPLASPTFTGSPRSVTPVTSSNDFSIATTAYVKAQGYSTTSGTVTSVAMTVPTGLSVSGTPITTSGTLAVVFASGYSIPTNTGQANWNTAYTYSQVGHLPLAGGTLTGALAGTSATFTGNVGIGMAAGTIPGEIKGRASDGKSLRLWDNGSTDILDLYNNGTNAYINTTHAGGAGNPLLIQTNSITALTLDTSQNATFSGAVGISASPSGGYALNMGGHINMQANDIYGGDNSQILLGASQDLQIYHDGSNSYIKDAGTGDLRIWSDNPNIATASGNKIFYGNNGAAELYHTGAVKKFETTSTGVTVSGSIKMADDATAASATNVGTQRYRTSGSNSYVDMCMQTGASSYAWVNILENNW